MKNKLKVCGFTIDTNLDSIEPRFDSINTSLDSNNTSSNDHKQTQPTLKGFIQAPVRKLNPVFLRDLLKPIASEHFILNQCWTDLWPSPHRPRDHYGRLEVPITELINRQGLSIRMQEIRQKCRVS